MADRSASGSGGVRNMLAMFEAKNEQTSPPSRGRSPAAGSESVRSSSSRPISKVRTSFVTVEKSGSFGPMLGLRKTSDAVDTASSTGKIEEEALESQSQDTRHSTESASTPSKSQAKSKEAKAEGPQLANGKQIEIPASKAHTDTQVDGSKDEHSSLEPHKNNKSQVANQQPPGKSTSSIRTSSGPQNATSKTQGNPVVKNKPAPIGTTKGAPPGKSSAGKSPASASSSTAATQKSAATTQPKLSRTNSTIKPKPGPAKVSSPKVSSPKTAAPRTSTAKKTVKETFQAVKPKSPTKPVKPRTSDGDFFSRMMKPTASSASKTQDGPSSTSSGKASAEHSSTRTSTKRPSDADGDFLSRMMRPTASSASKYDTDTKSTKTSSNRGSRPSTTPVEGGFMARMMKPTASSASKTHDKVQATSSPPRKTEALKPKRKSDGTAVKQDTKEEIQPKQESLQVSAPSEVASKAVPALSKMDNPEEAGSAKSARDSPAGAAATPETERMPLAERPKEVESAKAPSASGVPSTPKKDVTAPVKTQEPSVRRSKRDEEANTKTPEPKPEPSIRRAKNNETVTTNAPEPKPEPSASWSKSDDAAATNTQEPKAEPSIRWAKGYGPPAPKTSEPPPEPKAEPSIRRAKSNEAATTKAPESKPEQLRTTGTVSLAAPNTPTKSSQQETSTTAISSPPKQSKEAGVAPATSPKSPTTASQPATSTTAGSSSSYSPKQPQTDSSEPKTPSEESSPENTAKSGSVTQAKPTQEPTLSAKNQTPAFDAATPTKETNSFSSLPSLPSNQKDIASPATQIEDSAETPEPVHPKRDTSKTEPTSDSIPNEPESTNDDPFTVTGSIATATLEARKDERKVPGPASEEQVILANMLTMSNNFVPHRFGDDEDNTS